jgi:hypothetical protein
MFSPTYISALVVVLVSIFSLFKVNITKEDIEPILTALITLIGGIIVLIRRFKQGDLTVIGTRK